MLSARYFTVAALFPFALIAKASSADLIYLKCKIDSTVIRWDLPSSSENVRGKITKSWDRFKINIAEKEASRLSWKDGKWEEESKDFNVDVSSKMLQLVYKNGNLEDILKIDRTTGKLSGSESLQNDRASILIDHDGACEVDEPWEVKRKF